MEPTAAIVRFISNHPNATPQEIADGCHLEYSYVEERVKVLKMAGFIQAGDLPNQYQIRTMSTEV